MSRVNFRDKTNRSAFQCAEAEARGNSKNQHEGLFHLVFGRNILIVDE